MLFLPAISLASVTFVCGHYDCIVMQCVDTTYHLAALYQQKGHSVERQQPVVLQGLMRMFSDFVGCVFGIKRVNVMFQPSGFLERNMYLFFFLDP